MEPVSMIVSILVSVALSYIIKAVWKYVRKSRCHVEIDAPCPTQ